MIKLMIHSDKNHVERSILPCLLWIKQTSKEDGIPVTGRAVTLGWWKWGVSIATFNIENETDRTIF